MERVFTDHLGDWKRGCCCGEPRTDGVGRELTLMGWAQTRRDHGGLIFVDLRDRTGIVQVVFNPEVSQAAHEKAKQIRSEDVLSVRGLLVRRPPETVNPGIATGEVELVVRDVRLLNASQVPPFPIEDETDANENTRLKYRYLDLRRPQSLAHLLLRYRMTKKIRDYLDGHGFVEVETPVLTKSTPEGARDYLVPSRIYPGKFYALPQSPQLFKQILMVGGLDRYFQIVRCFRDEDLRADRQPEFTQLDMEMSFVQPEDVLEVVEGLMTLLFKELKGIELRRPFPRMSWEEAMSRYGTDKPDLRFGLKLVDFSLAFKGSQVKVFSGVIERGGVVKGIRVSGGGIFSRKELDDLTTFVGQYGAKGLAWIKMADGEWQSPIAKFLSEKERSEILELTEANSGDIIFFVADESKVVHESLANLRLHLGERLGLISEKDYSLVWVVDFPLLEYDAEEKRYISVHHPFTAPLEKDLDLLEKEPLRVGSKAYDLVLNGVEVGGGSVRIHQPDLQKRILGLLGIGPEEAEEKFGFFLEALGFGAPPHGGIAFGIDRMAMILSGARSLRDVIAFPKSQRAVCLLTDAPSSVDAKQLKELGIKTVD
ncbi:MAG: aspartate--tRNA ligase [Deltaproteobacteria bacterium]|nr:aspartate--tRNA ligase [Deltaproteobacteria bacterium]